MKDLTVIVPVYNAEKYLASCIESVRRQSFSNWEMILIDDGSTDNSGLICDNYSHKDARISVIHQDNQGCVSARRNGIMALKTAYCCFLDADDILPKHALKTMISGIPDTQDSFVVIGNISRMFRGVPLPQRRKSPCFNITSSQVYSNRDFINDLYCSWFGISNVPVNLWAKLYPSESLKETYKKIQNSVRFMGEDLIITLDIMPKVSKVVILPTSVYFYRIGGGTTKYQPDMMNDWLTLYRYKSQYAEKYPMPQNIGKLMDVELVNMTYTFFEMLQNFEMLSDSKILEVCNIDEVSAAAKNSDIDSSFSKAKAIREKDIKKIKELLQKSAKQKIFDALKKTLFRFA